MNVESNHSQLKQRPSRKLKKSNKEIDIKCKMGTIREVWSHNLEEELINFDRMLQGFNVIAFDTEFPGFIRNTPREATESVRFDDLRFNVNQTKLIQLGITLSDGHANIGGTWEFNFRDFREEEDVHVGVSIFLLKKNGINFEKLASEGIPIVDFAPKLLGILRSHSNVRWVTFHGLYDTAYLLKLLTNREIPNSVDEFVGMAAEIFGSVSDVKYMARYCEGLLGGELGLERLAKILKVDRIGSSHQAGSDSLLTAELFGKIIHRFQLSPELFHGFLYGLSFRILRAGGVLFPPPPPLLLQRCQPLVPGLLPTFWLQGPPPSPFLYHFHHSFLAVPSYHFPPYDLKH